VFKVVPAGQAAPAPQPTPTPAAEPKAAIPTPADASTSSAPVTAAATPAEPAKEAELSPKFAELARKESAIRKVATTLKAQQAELAQAKAQLEQQLASDPFAALASKGWTPEKLIEAAIARGVKPPEASQPAQSSPEIAALKAEIEALKEGSKKAVDTQYQAALKQIEGEATKLTDAPEYATIKARGAVKDVVELVEKHFKATGEVIPTSEAMKLVEAELIEEGLKWAQIETVKAKLSPPKPAEEPAATPGTPAALEWKTKKTGMPAKIVPSGNQVKTLTQSMNPGTRPMTARERALAILKGEPV